MDNHHSKQMEAFQDFDEINEEDDEFIVDDKNTSFGNDLVDLNIPINATNHPLNDATNTSTSKLNVSNDHDISYDDSVNTTSFADPKKKYETQLMNQK